MTYNPIMMWILYSPLHGMLSGFMMVINYTGCKTRKAYRTPIGYKRDGDTLVTISYKHRKWWRNLRGGAPVILRLQGKDVHGIAEVDEDEAGVVQGMKIFIGGNPRAGRMFGVKVNNDGQADPESLLQAAKERVVVRTKLD